MIDIEIFFVADLNGYRLAKVETLLRRNQIYIYIYRTARCNLREAISPSPDRETRTRAITSSAGRSA